MRRGAKPETASKSAQRLNERAAAVPPDGKTPAAAARRSPRKRRSVPTSALEKTIGYRFKDRDLLDRSLTHISAIAGGSRANSYQRLEFLGDHVLGLIISDMLFRAFPKADEGELSRRLADLVRRESCADVARAIELGSALRLGASEANAGGRMRTAILADVCEALVGAVYLDGGYDASAKLVEAVRQGHLDGLVLQNPFQMGYLAVATLGRHLRGEAVEARIDTGATFVGKHNLERPEIRDLIAPDLTPWLGE